MRHTRNLLKAEGGNKPCQTLPSDWARMTDIYLIPVADGVVATRAALTKVVL